MHTGVIFIVSRDSKITLFQKNDRGTVSKRRFSNNAILPYMNSIFKYFIFDIKVQLTISLNGKESRAFPKGYYFFILTSDKLGF